MLQPQMKSWTITDDGGKIMDENLRLLFQDVTTVNIDCFRSLQGDWINEANNKGYWNQLVKRLLHPDTPIPECPETWRLLPSWRARRAASRRHPSDRDADDDNGDDEGDSNDGNDDSRHHREGHSDESR